MDILAVRSDLYAGHSLSEAVVSKMVGTALPWLRIPVPHVKEVLKRWLIDPTFDPFLLPYGESVEMQQLFFWSVLARENDFARQMAFLQGYLGQAESWMITDGCSQYVRAAPAGAYQPFYQKMVRSKEEYERRFAYVLALRYAREDPTFFLRELRYDDHYYVYMAQAWLLATMAIVHYEEVAAFLAKKETPLCLLRKSVSKMQDSYRISPSHKKRAKRLLRNR
jgi:hypothetical protein